MTKNRYALRVLLHPIDSFWEMKFEKKGKLLPAVGLMMLFFLVTLFDRQVRAFPFNPAFNTPLDLMYQLQVFLVPVVLFCVGNWTITTLMDGKGKMRDIFMVLAYAFVPVILIRVPTAILSNLMTLEESAYLMIIDYAAIAWAAIILFVGIMTVHQYSFGKTVVTLVLTVCSALIIVFVCLLLFSLIQELIGFAYSVFREMTLRM